jgi:hypothetical protein
MPSVCVAYALTYGMLLELCPSNVQVNSMMKMTVFWDVAPCGLVEVYQRF